MHELRRFPYLWGLTLAEAKVLVALAVNETANYETICRSYAFTSHAAVRVTISRLRSKLLPHGIGIEMIHGVGFTVPEPGRTVLRRAGGFT